MIYYRTRLLESDNSSDSLNRYLSDMDKLEVEIPNLSKYLKDNKVKVFVDPKQKSVIEIHFDLTYDLSNSKATNFRTSSYKIVTRKVRQEFKKGYILVAMVALEEVMTLQDDKELSRFRVSDLEDSVSSIQSKSPEIFPSKEHVARIVDAEGYLGLSIGSSHDTYLVYTPATQKGRKVIEDEEDLVKSFFMKNKEVLDEYADGKKPFKLYEVGYAIDTDKVWDKLSKDRHDNKLFVLAKRGYNSSSDAEVVSVVAVDSKGNAIHLYCKDEKDIAGILNSNTDSRVTKPFVAYQAHSMPSLGCELVDSDNDNLEPTTVIGQVKFNGNSVESRGEIQKFITDDAWEKISTNEQYRRALEKKDSDEDIPKEVKQYLPSGAKVTRVKGENKVAVRILIERLP